MSSHTAPAPKDGGPDYHARALLRGLGILQAFNVEEPELTLTQLAERLNLNHSTTFRLLDCLKYAGFVEFDAQRKVWSLGLATFEVGSIYLATQSVERLARPYLEDLAHEQQQTANLGVRDGFSVVHLGVVVPARPLHYQTRVGARDSLHCTGLGKVLASGMSEEEVDQLIAAGLPAFTPNTITQGDQFREHLQHVRTQRYAFDDEERYTGLRCVAAPVTDRSGRLRAALSVSGSAADFTAHQLQQHVEAVQRAADALSRTLHGTA
jgi:DNA-binding IclR family transcriptional regulator